MEPSNSLSPPPAVVETLQRLSSKSGVVATMAMDRVSSTVLASTGNFLALSASASTTAANTSNPTSFGSATTMSAAQGETFTSTIQSTTIQPVPSPHPTIATTTKTTDGIPEFASRIWHYVSYSGQLVHDMDSEDDLKLLRLRTKKHEFMIVPDQKYIFVVVHEVSG